MKLLRSLFDQSNSIDALFDQKGKTLSEYQRESLIKMAKRQFEKLENLGLSIPVSLG